MTDIGSSPGAFIGRARELEQVGALLTAAEAGSGFLLLIRGEAGIGKTRLAEELSREAVRRGHAVHWGRCLELSGAPPFWPWVQVLRSIAGRGGLASAPAAEYASITRLVPELRSADGDAARQAAAAAGAPLEGEAERFRLFDGIAGFLRGVAAAAPAGIVLDDLHAADLPSLLLLEFVARQLDSGTPSSYSAESPRPPRASPALWIVGTYRDVGAHADPERDRLIARVTRVGRSLTLAGLSESEAGRLIVHTVGEVPRRLASRIYALTEGNPFFVDEVARLLWPAPGGGQSSRAAATVVPSGVREVVRQRLQPLGADCLRLLETAAVTGREASFAVLRQATGMESTRLLDVLDEAVAARVLVPQPGRSYTFGHALIRETLYESLATSTRAELHRRVGNALERLFPASLDEHLAELAFHFAHASPVADAGKALAYAERAARRATVLRGHSYRLLEVIDSGAAQEWETELEELMRLAERLREPRFLGMAVGTRAMRSVWLGRFGEAEALGRRALELPQSVNDSQIAISIAVQGFMRRLQGSADAAESSARAILAAAPAIPAAAACSFSLSAICNASTRRAPRSSFSTARTSPPCAAPIDSRAWCRGSPKRRCSSTTRRGCELSTTSCCRWRVATSLSRLASASGRRRSFWG
jgi:predicted ATPase